MNLTDSVWMIMILACCGWLLWHFLWKKQGSCHGCDHGDANRDKRPR